MTLKKCSYLDSLKTSALTVNLFRKLLELFLMFPWYVRILETVAAFLAVF